jgi:putative salt-induced outer membrane protein YdiY
MADYLLRSDTGVRVLLTERLAFSVEYQIKRDSRPPAGIAPNDRLLTTGLIIDF